MKCPRTGSYLTSVKVGGIAVQISEKCGGVFFDNLELEKFKNGTELRGNALVKHLKQFSLKLPNEKQRINCPKCAGTVMMRRFYSPLKIIETDECPSCAGIWLDTGELKKIQDNALSGAELARLRMEMIEQTAPAKIDMSHHKHSNWHKSKRHIDNLFDIAHSLFDSY